MSGAGRKTGRIVPKIDPHLDARIAGVADAQHGVVSLTQLEGLGLSDSGVRKRARSGRLHRVHRGVYAVGRRRLDLQGRIMAAVLSSGPAAVASHRAAAYLLGLLPATSAAIEVTVPCRSGRARPGIIIHRSSTLAKPDRTKVGSIPCTTVARTLLDLADVQPPRRLPRSIEAAERLGLYDGRAVAAVIERAKGRPAARRLSSALAAYEEPAPTKTELERQALELFGRAGLPRPRVNALVHTAEQPFEVDFCWPDRRLVVEADSFEWHRSRASFEEDRRRDQLLRAAGYDVVRVTWRQLAAHPGRVLAALRGPNR
jgi:predicted transcriptional regulator of viral defense system